MSLMLFSDESNIIPEELIVLPSPPVCEFHDYCIEQLKSKNLFPTSAIFRPFDPSARPDFPSKEWLCLPEYPFSIGIRYPFPSFIQEFFNESKICYSQAMPMIWRILFILQYLIDNRGSDIGIPELSYTYHLKSHGTGYYLLQVRNSRSPLVLNTTQNDLKWKNRFFFVHRESVPDGMISPISWRLKAALPQSFGEDLGSRILEFLKISTEERSFFPPDDSDTSWSSDSAFIMPDAANWISHFTLADLEVDMAIPLKVEMPSSTPVKTRSSNRSKVLPQKRKDIETDHPLPSFDQIVTQLKRRYQEDSSSLNDLNKALSIKDLALKDKIIELQRSDKKVAELEHRLSTILAEMKVQHSQELETLSLDMKRDAAVAVYECRIAMAEEAISKGLEIPFWPVQTWRVNLSKLTGKEINTGQSHGLGEKMVKEVIQQSGEEGTKVVVGNEGNPN